MAVYRRNFAFKFMVVDDYIGRSRWKMDAAFPILARTSGSESPSLIFFVKAVGKWMQLFRSWHVHPALN